MHANSCLSKYLSNEDYGRSREKKQAATYLLKGLFVGLPNWQLRRQEKETEREIVLH